MIWEMFIGLLVISLGLSAWGFKRRGSIIVIVGCLMMIFVVALTDEVGTAQAFVIDYPAGSNVTIGNSTSITNVTIGHWEEKPDELNSDIRFLLGMLALALMVGGVVAFRGFTI